MTDSTEPSLGLNR